MVQATSWKGAWIDIRDRLAAKWRTVENAEAEATIDCQDELTRMAKLEKAKGYVPKIDFVLNRISNKAAKIRSGNAD